jgi:ATP-dependent Clp endopeptidase proteolytic subunit ClpP
MSPRWAHPSKKRFEDDNSDDEDEVSGSSTGGGVLIKVHKNEVYFYDEVTKESVLHLINTLLKLREKYTKRIYLFIHSEGGDLHAGMSAMDHISNLGVEVRTVIDGFVASAATLMFLAGTKRYTMPSANLLIHQLSTEFWGKFQDLQDEMANSEGLMNTIKSVYKKHTTIPSKEIKSLLKREMYLSAEKCIEYNIAHKIYKRKIPRSKA